MSATVPHTLAPRSTKCIFLGYPQDHKGYRCLDLHSNKIITSHHVVFDELTFPLASQSSIAPASYSFFEFAAATDEDDTTVPCRAMQPASTRAAADTPALRPATRGRSPSHAPGATRGRSPSRAPHAMRGHSPSREPNSTRGRSPSRALDAAGSPSLPHTSTTPAQAHLPALMPLSTARSPRSLRSTRDTVLLHLIRYLSRSFLRLLQCHMKPACLGLI